MEASRDSSPIAQTATSRWPGLSRASSGFVGGVHRDGLRHEIGGFVDPLAVLVDGEHLGSAFRKGAGERQAELAETDDENLIGHI